MILAAGLGTRLGDITRSTPKALVDVGGVPVLERVARALIAAGADRLIINVHHHADSIIRFVEERDRFGVDVRFSHEPDAPLETGGGLLNAARHFRGDAPFLLHNVDVLTDADLRRLYEEHVAGGALATLAVSRRTSSRMLLFDALGLCGRFDRRTGERTAVRRVEGDVSERAFAGIHVISPELFAHITERGAFSILDVYLRLAAGGARIAAHDIGAAVWLEIGSPARLDAARAHFSRDS